MFQPKSLRDLGFYYWEEDSRFVNQLVEAHSCRILGR